MLECRVSMHNLHMGANLLPGANLHSDANVHPLASSVAFICPHVPRFYLKFNTRFSVLRINSMC